MQFIHEITAEQVIKILQTGAWNTFQQSLTSKDTNTNEALEASTEQIELGENTSGVDAFGDIDFSPEVKEIIDVGGGRFDVNVHFMAKKGISLMVWDPFNRSFQHNEKIKSKVSEKKLQAATSMSVLNVIPELDVRLAHIATLKEALALGGVAYFKIWPGEGYLKGSYFPSRDDTSFQANAHADRFLREIEVVFGENNVQLHTIIPNLITATKEYQNHSSKEEIIKIQKKSLQESSHFISKQQNGLANINAKSLFFSPNTFFQKPIDSALYEHRHYDEKLRHEFDKRYGILPIVTPNF